MRLVSYLNDDFSAITYSEYLKIFRKVLILGATDDKDPISIGLGRLFQSSVTMSGAMGTGKVRRSLAENFEFGQGYTTILSDMDQTEEYDEESYRRHIKETLIAYINQGAPDVLFWKLNYGTTELKILILRLLEDDVPEIGNYFISFIDPKYRHQNNYETYLFLYKLAEKVERVHLGLEGPSASTILVGLNSPLTFSRILIQSLDHLILLRAILPLSQIFVAAELKASELRDLLPLLLYNLKEVHTSRLIGTEGLLATGSVSIDRVMLTRRTAGILQLRKGTIDETNIETLAPGAISDLIKYRLYNVGDFTREVQRNVLARNIFQLDSLPMRLKHSDNYHYIGVGDEKVRNIRCVPTTSPYTIVDPRTPQYYYRYNVTVINELFPWDNTIIMFVRRLHDMHSTKDMIFFFTFMLYNDNPTKEELLRRLAFLGILFRSEGYVYKIIFNVYLLDGLESTFHVISPNVKIRVGNGIYLEKITRPDITEYRGTFGERYPPVILLTRNEVMDVFRDLDVGRLIMWLPTRVDFYQAMWCDGIGCDSEGESFVRQGVDFSRLWSLSRVL
nr:MAG: hypothetical protein [Planococcus ficus-associated reovirus 1]